MEKEKTCNHKFIYDLQLNYVNWEVKTLFIGTFNPDWEVCNNNYAKWFYGRTKNNDFWCILPKVFGKQSLTSGSHEDWKNFCREHKIAITDIIESITADPEIHKEEICKFQDDKLEKFDKRINNIPRILELYPTIEQICITRQTLTPFWTNCFSDTLHYIKSVPNRSIKVRMLRSPSRGALKGVEGNFCNFIANRWIEQGFKIL